MPFSVSGAESRLEPFDLFRNSSKRMPRPKHAYSISKISAAWRSVRFRIDTSLNMPIFSSVALLPEIGFDSREHAESAYDGRKETIEGGKLSRGLCKHLQNCRLPMALHFRYSRQNFLCLQDTFFLPHVSFAPVRAARDGLRVIFEKFQVHLLLFLRWFGLWECLYKLVQIVYRLYSQARKQEYRIISMIVWNILHHSDMQHRTDPASYSRF